MIYLRRYKCIAEKTHFKNSSLSVNESKILYFDDVLYRLQSFFKWNPLKSHLCRKLEKFVWFKVFLNFLNIPRNVLSGLIPLGTHCYFILNCELLKSSTNLPFSTLSSSRYKSNMKQLQNLIFDQPISSSVERATWWIEYVIRHEGTKHLNNDGYKTLSWYKYLMIDVMFAVFFGMLAMLFGFVYVIHKIRNYSKSLPFEKVTRGSKCKVL